MADDDQTPKPTRRSSKEIDAANLELILIELRALKQQHSHLEQRFDRVEDVLDAMRRALDVMAQLLTDHVHHCTAVHEQLRGAP